MTKTSYKWTINGPPAKRHLNDVPTLNAGLVAVIFQGIRTSIAKEPYIFVIFQGGPNPLSPSPLDPRMTRTPR